MELLNVDAGFQVHRRYGVYVHRRLQMEKFTDQTLLVEVANKQIVVLGRAWEDSELPIQIAMADRDGARGPLIEEIKLFRKQLAARATRAEKKAPYTLIFPDHAAYYTKANLNDTAERSATLIGRIKEHLEETHALRIEFLPKLQHRLDEFNAAVESIRAANLQRDIAADKLTQAITNQQKLLENVFGVVTQKYDSRAKADTFFPSPRPYRPKTKTPKTKTPPTDKT